LSQAANLYADVVGRVSSISQSVALSEQTHQYGPGAPVDRDQMREYGGFVSDQWRIAPTVTITAGLRIEKQGAFVNLDNLYSEVSYAGIWGVSGVGNLFSPGVQTGSAPVYTPVSNPYNPPPVFAPSIGVAWQLPAREGFLGILTGHKSGDAVLRGGYNIATVREGMGVFYAIYGQNQGLTQSTSISPTTYPTIFGPAGSVEFSDSTIPSRNSTIAATPSYPIADTTNSVYGIDPNLKMGYVQSWNLSYQRTLDRNTVVDFRLVGNHGTDLWREINLNETNIYNNGYLAQFQAAQNNLAIARGGNIYNNTGVINFGNQGLPGQVNIPMISTALGTTSDSTTAGYLTLGQAGSAASAIATNSTRMAALTAAGYAANLFQVNPLLGGGANLLTNDGSSYYDAFQVEARHRMSNGFTITGSYSFAKNLADGATASSYDTSQPTTLRNMGLDRLVTGFDIRHAIKFNWIYQLPFGPGRTFNPSNFVARKIVEGWQLSGVVRLQSGTPIELGSFATVNTNGSGVVLHNITLSQLQSEVGIYKTNLVGPNGPIVYYLPPPTTTSTAGLNSTNNTNLIYNTQAAFQTNGLTPANIDPSAPYIGPSTAGNMGYQDFIYLPWQRHFDLELQKNTRIGEKLQLQIAASALDVLNLTNFLPGSGNTSSTFGQVTSAYRDISGTVDPGARIIEFKVRLNF
jgi:hypothetical protein